MRRAKRTNAVLMSLMLAFVITLGAGVVVGVAAGRRSSPVPDAQVPVTTRPAEPRGPWLADALGLNTEQREKLKAIWTEAVQGPSQRADMSKRSQLFKQRDEALYNLLTDEQKQQYQNVMADYKTKIDELNKEREKAIQEAVERTKLMLDDKQRAQYEQILKDHGPLPHGEHDRQPRGGGPHGHGGAGHGPHFGEPRTQPMRGGPAFEQFKESKESGIITTRPG